MSAPGRPKRESSLGEAVAQRLEGGPFGAPGPKSASSARTAGPTFPMSVVARTYG